LLAECGVVLEYLLYGASNFWTRNPAGWSDGLNQVPALTKSMDTAAHAWLLARLSWWSRWRSLIKWLASKSRSKGSLRRRWDMLVLLHVLPKASDDVIKRWTLVGQLNMPSPVHVEAWLNVSHSLKKINRSSIIGDVGQIDCSSIMVDVLLFVKPGVNISGFGRMLELAIIRYESSTA
jgi:hypothetical protein